MITKYGPQRRWAVRNRDKVLAINRKSGRKHGRKYRLKKNYNVTPDQYQIMLIAQGNVCAICRGSLGTKPCVDHSHLTGSVRAILCARCNLGISFLEPAAWRQEAFRYLYQGGQNVVG